MTPTLEQIDKALKTAESKDAPEVDVALLWLARAELSGIEAVGPGYLADAMGITEEHALDLFAVLGEHGFVEDPEGAE